MELLCSMELLYIIMCLLQSSFQLIAYQRLSLLYLSLCYSQVLQRHMVELFLIRSYRGITLCFYIKKDSSHRCIQFAGITNRTLQQFFQLLLSGIFIYFH